MTPPPLSTLSAAPQRLRVEGLDAPIGIWTATPRFSWLPAEPQTGYELEVLDAQKHHVVAGTGMIDCRTGAHVEVPGFTARSRGAYMWRVRVRGEDGSLSDWTESQFETSILDPADWQAVWIEPEQDPTTPEPEFDPHEMMGPGGIAALAPAEERLRPTLLVRQEFTVQHTGRARLYVTAHGLYEVRINGRPITDTVLNPGYEEYHERMPFQVYDVSDAVNSGENVIGVTLADGWWAGRISFPGTGADYGDRLGLLWQIEIDGGVVAASGTDAVSSTGETRYADLFVGEFLDARRAKPGWATAAFDARDWAPVHNAVYNDRDVLVPFVGEPIRRVMEIADATILQTDDGDTIIDLGQNIVGRIRLRATGPAGTRIKLEHTEVLDEKGRYLNNIMGRNKDQTDVWILNGDGDEVFEPRFTFHGFRYVRITGYPGELRAEHVVGVVIASDLEPAGTFVTDNPLINRLHENVVWSQRGNFLSIPTDCPQRERAGWTGDLRVYVDAATNNARVDLFLERWLANARAAQREDGQIPEIVPYNASFERMMTTLPAFGDEPTHGISNAGWSDAIILVPLALYERYGDLRVLEQNFDAMRRWHRYVRGVAQSEMPSRYQTGDVDAATLERQQYLWNTGWHFGDWLVPSTVTEDPRSIVAAAKLTREIVASICYYESTRALARVSRLLGDVAFASDCEQLATKIATAFAAEFVDADGRLTPHMQGSYILALAHGLIPAPLRDRSAQHLVTLIEEADQHLDTGFLSMQHLLPVLVQIGRPDLAYELLLQDTVPSWLYQVKMGATTVWEEWSAILPDGRPKFLSLNHYAFGCVDDWLFTHVAGIQPAEPGYRRVIIAPDLNAPFARVTASRVTPYGEIRVAMTGEPDGRRVRVTVPAGVEAVLRVARVERVLPAGEHVIDFGEKER